MPTIPISIVLVDIYSIGVSDHLMPTKIVDKIN